MRLYLVGAAVCIASAAAATAIVVPVRAAFVRTTTTCDAANPFDNEPDDAALQACLDNYDAVLLQPDDRPGYVGYLVSNTIKIKRKGGLLTSAAIPAKATIRAAPDLSSSMLRASDVDDFDLSFIRFDGNRENRLVRDKPCTTAALNHRNVELIGNGFSVRYVESFRAVCGSAMTVGDSSDFIIYRSLFYDNGRQPEDADGIAGLWSDGLTVFKCVNATIRDNDFWDNTDVDLGVNGGSKCAVYRNTITHSSKYAFAGLVVGDPSRSGGEFSNNVVTSGFDLLGFGIIVGCHPWAQCGGGYASGVAVYDNVTLGAVVNFAVDGLNGGSIRKNVMHGAQGSRLVNCPGPAADYTVGHAINVGPLQTGYAVRVFDPATACPSSGE
jgi:parallel beta helix pectate lyase-like protein